jgi:ABC-type nitrate/sulfonate/bicarbonate transport system substrate-binding protein
VAALAEACAWCDEPQHREPLAQLLAEADHLNLPARVIAPALTGRFDCGNGQIETTPDFHIFHRGDANVPTAAKATELQSALIGAGLLIAANTPSELPSHLFREDLYRDALHTNQTHEAIS